ncbi:sulfotransferase family 2 domain-containing protein [Shewanella sedimentimangrovi]|uniref:Sulfotransferase family 2 domain-containing protein n=1 Tax=Shewanella sedimentimangrovi TaxID=2814293 RepID=A0ABX7R0W9_9GAMM|nr:sulfotransferase family 2 domain-containing protein [Shewanella sedimentimangrovi]QSX37413.1 sulfotransferase family 2 domain-containing protein [Shewanella sedimentimangrovi]
MLISHQKRFIFIHIPRTGGTSLRQLLLARVKDCQPLGFQHSGAHTEGETFFESYQSYLIFTVIRSPWSRIYSWYKLINHYAPALCRPNQTFDDFIQALEHQKPRMHQVDNFHFNQLDYILSRSGRLITNKVLRFENYRQEVTRLCSDLGLEGVTIPHLNDVAGSSLPEAYSEYPFQAVARLCARDIRYFNYPDSPFLPRLK